MRNLIRKNIQKLKPNINGYNENIKNCILLNANKNLYLPYSNNEECINANRYYDDNLYKLYKIFANLYNINEKNLIITEGSDEAVKMLIKSCCEPNEDYIMTFSSTFSMYKFYATVRLYDGVFKNPIKYTISTEKENDVFISLLKDLENNNAK